MCVGLPPISNVFFPVYLSFLSGITAYPRDSCLQEGVRHSLRVLNEMSLVHNRSPRITAAAFSVFVECCQHKGFQAGASGKTPSANAGDT